MKVFLDSSVILAACGSAKGASRALFNKANANGWSLLASPYVCSEIEKNLGLFPISAIVAWSDLKKRLILVEDIVTLDQIHIFAPAKDRPVLFTALAWASVLLTWDRHDFQGLLGNEFYGLKILTPMDFFDRERQAGKLKGLGY